MNAPTKKRLKVISTTINGKDAHIRANSVPAMTGSEPIDLECGSCGMILAAGCSPERIHARFVTDQRLVFECICGALNVVPEGQRAIE